MARLFSLFTTALLMLAFIVNAQPTIKKTPVSRTNAASGAEMFRNYCAACHGEDGRGAGPAAPAMKKAPANLTELTAKNNGKFPDARVAEFIRGDQGAPEHGSRDMPVWGSLLPSVSSSTGEVQLRISNLTDYIKSIQGK